ncbi:MAG: hypothetical protein EOP57_00800 [Sphingomonadales bacterium]|nr:MAG: hypothetical protein EOP57_00800 [Sphingomonadales bacterium]
MDGHSGLTWDDFFGREGSVYTLEAGGMAFALQLDRVQQLADSGRTGGSFRLEFVGPATPILAQSIYVFRDADGEREIFIVPIAGEPAGARYEAVFY